MQRKHSKSQQLFIIFKNLRKIGIEQNFNSVEHHKNLTTTIILNGERLNGFPLRWGYPLTTLIQPSAGSPSHCNTAGTGNTGTISEKIKLSLFEGDMMHKTEGIYSS